MRVELIVSAAVLAACATGNADDKKPAAKTLAEEAQLLSAKEGWVSVEVTLTLTGGKKEKGRVAIQFAVEKGKPSGKVTSGIIFGDGKTEVGAWVGDKDTFELVEKDGQRFIKIARPDVKDFPVLTYTLEGDALTVKKGVSFNWAGAGVSLENTKFTPVKPKK